VGRWDQNGSLGDWLGGCGLDSTGSGQRPVAGCCECGDEPSGSCAAELVSLFQSQCPFKSYVQTFKTYEDVTAAVRKINTDTAIRYKP
jgi:hypothetical protein